MNAKTKEMFKSLTKFYNTIDFKSEAAASTGPTGHELRADLIESLFLDKQNPVTSAEVHSILSTQEVELTAPSLSFPITPSESMALRLYNLAKKESSKPEEKPTPPCTVYYKTPGQGDDIHPTLGENILYDVSLTEMMNPDIKIKDGADIMMAKIDSDITSPVLRGASILEGYLNYIPNIERSKCVPYLKVKFITTEQEPLVVLDFLGATKDSFGGDDIMNEKSADHLFAQGSKVDDQNFYGGGGTIQGMELFTMPQSLIAKHSKYSDPFRPLLSLNGADINIHSANQGFISYKNASLRMTLFDRTKLNDISFLLDPSRFGETVVELSAGWTHPDNNSVYGAIINEMTVNDLYKITKSDFSLTKASSIDITLSLAALGGGDIIKKSALTTNRSKVVELKEYYRTISGLSRRYSKLASQVNLKKSGSINILPSIVIESKDSKQAIPIDSEKVALVHKKLDEFKTLLSDKDENNNTLTAVQLKELDTIIAGLSDGAGSTIKSYETALSEQVKAFTDFIGVPKTAAPAEAPAEATTPAAPAPSPAAPAAPNIVDFFLLEGVNATTHISFGKLFLNTVGLPMIDVNSNESVGDVQILMYNFNKYAGEMGYNESEKNPNQKNSIASFALEKESLIREMEVIIKKKYQLTAIDIINYARKKMNSKYDPQFGIITGGDNSEFDKAETKIKQLAADKKNLSTEKDNEPDDTKKAALIAEISKKQVEIDATLVIIEDLRIAGEGNILNKLGASKIRMPKLKLHIESNVITRKDEKNKDKSTLQIRYHVYDENQKPYEYQESALSIQESIIVSSKESGLESTPGASFIDILKETKAIEVIKSSGIGLEVKYKIIGRNLAVKKAIKSSMPSITYGTESTAINSVSISSISDKNIDTHHLLEARQKKSDTAQGKNPESEEKSITEFNAQIIHPVTVNINMLGCTVLEFGQQLFVDFETNTDLDNVYGIFGITHSIKPGSFSTDVKLTPTFSGESITFKDMIDDLTAEHNRLKASLGKIDAYAAQKAGDADQFDPR